MIFQNKVALVTGGSRGIGKAIVERLFREGAKVAINCATSVAEAQKVADSLDASGSSTAVFQANVAVRQEVRDMFARIIERFGRIDILINCAGLGISRDSALALSQEDWDRGIDVNFKGSAYCATEAIHWMKEQGGGDIVNIATSAIYAPRGGTIPYSASKAAVVNMSRALAWEFGPCGIRVNVVAPGPTETDMVKMFFTPERLAKTIQEVPLRKICQPEDIAGAVCFLLTSDAVMITGQTLVVDGGRSLRHLES
ncbi:SDR family NAD(P)-dependent oxidoreductase [Propionispora hippei]|uniref:3-oxoacyl-[acyl-carrier protein] reductase n=1 Tax=Propionispora hippei DSM 15287 TaxID=1123003 RepID=A0A1M6CNH1_9FIRM|nr:3-oxoacyl-ACP reductase family protein [Propionispora hippei]SHI62547.1 3-oxoacyl-[acyl-carrier protein] reductase [Propionispora hippei DSM 15287]